MISKIVSVNVGKPSPVSWKGRSFVTSIFKEPVHGQIKVGRLGLEGDMQADISVHGGPKKAVYAYSAEHYEYWKRLLQTSELPWGSFGENLTTESLLEEHTHLGDKLKISSAEFMVTQPRFPCYKLGIKFKSMEMVERFQASDRSGFYLAIVREGYLSVGDLIELIGQNVAEPTIADVFSPNQEHNQH